MTTNVELTAPSVSGSAGHSLFFSLGSNAKDASPKRYQYTWPEFVAWLYKHPRFIGEKDGPYVVLADFGGGRRALDSLVASYGVPLDFDSGHVDEAVIRAVMTGYAFVAYSSYSHQHAAPRWRVFVPTSAPMTNAEHYATWAMLNAAFGGAADPAAKDPSRLSYLPGKCLHPEQAAIFHSDGALLQPAQVTEAPPSALQAQTDGPVPGWAGPSDDNTLVEIACSLRNRPDERFGGPIHFAMLWSANEEWLAQRFPPSPSEQGQAYSRTQADMALSGELAYWTGNDRARMGRLMIASGLCRDDDDWKHRKVWLAVDNAIASKKQWHFMKADVPAGTPADAPVNAVAQEASSNYFSFHPTGEFIYRPTGDRTPATVLDNVIGKDARMVLYLTHPVHRMTWAPGFPERFQVKQLDDTDHKAADSWLYNKYQAPRTPTREGDVSPWLNLIARLYPEDVDHIVNYFADAVQFPQFKCNHALVLGSGVHGIGKDTLLAPLRHAVGGRNFAVIKPSDLVSPYNPWAASRVVQISESRDLGEGHAGISRYDMYERCKDLAAAPPTTLLCNDKYEKQHQVLNVLRLVLTTNHGVDGLYIDPLDRRHYCAWSDAEKMTEDESEAIWEWYHAGGKDYVAHYLYTLDLGARGFNRSAPPPQTAWWHQLVEGGRPAEDDRFSDALDKLGKPEWVTLAMIAQAAGLELAGWIAAPGNKRKVEREMDRSGYRRFPNPAEPKKGRWYVNGQRVVVYRRANVAIKDLLHKFSGGPGGP